MTAIKNEALLHAELAAVDKKIALQNNEKINIFLNSIGIRPDKDLPKEYLQWSRILIVVPNRNVMNELKPYKFSIEGIQFAINTNAETIHVFNYEDWEKAFKFKTALQIRESLKNSFGGIRRLPDNSKKEL